MREFKFRGWNDKIKFMSKPFSFGQVLNFNDQIIKSLSKDEIVMQFSGLKDKNEVDIFEGDIVIYDRGVGNWTGQRMSTTHEIKFSDEIFAFVLNYPNSYVKLRKHWNYTYEVIGNIHENPELLAVPTAVL